MDFTSSCSYAKVKRRSYTVYAKLHPGEYHSTYTPMAGSTLLVHLKHTNKHIHTVSKVNTHVERKQNTWDDAKGVYGKMNMTCLEKQSNKRRLLPHIHIPIIQAKGVWIHSAPIQAFAHTTQGCQLNY